MALAEVAQELLANNLAVAVAEVAQEVIAHKQERAQEVLLA
jgi:hypothetical protein